jgi:F0F1-type ATP synthase assembly protein I
VDCEKRAEHSGTESEAARQSLTPPLNAAIIPALFHAEIQEKRLARKVLWVQILVVLAAVGITASGWGSSPQYAIAVFGGGGVSVLNGALLAWRMSRAAMYPAQDAHLHLRLLYYYAIERFLAVVVSLGICMTVLRLSPLAVLGGFVLGQSVLLLARLFIKIKTEDSD